MSYVETARPGNSSRRLRPYRSRTNALLDAMYKEARLHREIFGTTSADPLIEGCRPIVRAAFEDFLSDREQWADDVITAAEDGFRLNRLFDGERFVRDRADAILKMGWLMAYYYPKDNPLIEAQGKRSTALGILRDWDGQSPFRIKDIVVLGLGCLLRDLDSREPIYDGPGVIFPRHVGVDGAMTELKRWFRLAVGPEANAMDDSPAQTANDELTEPADERPAPPTKAKRSTQKGEGQAKLISALTRHHKYADDGCLNQEPIGSNKLAREAGVSGSTASAFFKRKFKGYAKYRAKCRNTTGLVQSLKALNGEYAPHDLYGDKPPGERDHRDDE